MDDTLKRLKEASEACIAAYEKWAGNRKDSSASETLHEAVHELRKVGARVEIELAISERDENALKPMPIPPHRASQPRGRNGDEADDSFGNNIGNSDPAQPARNFDAPRQQQRSGGGGGGPRRHGGGGHGGGKRPQG